MAGEDHKEAIYETRNEKMVFQNDDKCRLRIARFLKPCAKRNNEAVRIPKTPLLSEVFPHNLQQWPCKVSFRGWNCPQVKWKEWVDKLAPKYSSIWVQTGICDAILNSIYEVRCNEDLVLGLSEFWCSHTNTFVFPWGEATVTLEDIMILGGYPVLGEPVTSPLNEKLMKIEQEMIKHRMLLSRSKARKAGHSGWLKRFMEAESEFEHVAFLSLWLSRYVFPSLSEETIGKHVFPIAAKLSQGIKVSLAPAVLASFYKDLRLLRKQAMASSKISISGPFQLVQIWAFERFKILGPKALDKVEPGEPRVARWHKLSSKLNLPLVRLVVRSTENFQWRPYAANLKNWQHPSYYKEKEQFVIGCSSLDDQELQSFGKCLQACYLFGIDCKEKYLPHRVAMQFGMDQDLPGDISNINFSNGNFKFFVPPRSLVPGVSVRYFSWWKDMRMAREVAMKEVLRKKKNLKIPNKPSDILKNPSSEKGHKLITPHPKVIKHYEDSSEDDIPIAIRMLKSCNQSQNVGSSTLCAVYGSSGKGSLFTNKERTLPKREINREDLKPPPSSVLGARAASRQSTKAKALPSVKTTRSKFGIPISPHKQKSDVQNQNATHDKPRSADGSDFIPVRVKKRGGEPLDPLDFVCLSRRIKQMKGGRRDSGKVGGEDGEMIKVGDSSNNSLNVNIYMDTKSGRFHKHELEGRMQRIEKMLGVDTD